MTKKIKTPGYIKRFLKHLKLICSELDKKGKFYFHSIWIGVIIIILLFVYEPMDPFHAPILFIVLGFCLYAFFAVSRRRGVHAGRSAWQWVKSHKKTTIIGIVLIAVFYISLIAVPLGDSPFSGLSKEQLTGKIEDDFQNLKSSIYKMDSVLRGLRANKKLFELEDITLLKSEDRERVLKLWREFSMQIMYYDHLVDEYRFFYRIFYFKHKFLHNKAFVVGYTAFLNRYLCGNELLNLVHANEMWETILDESDRERAIPAGMYTQLRNNILHVNDMARFTVGYGHLQFLKGGLEEEGFTEREAELFNYIDACFSKCMLNMTVKSAIWVPKNGLDFLKRRSFRIWFPLQKKAASATGYFRLTPRHENYIKPEHLRKLDDLLEPGDILLERRNWYLSNVGLPGFWPHAALYVGGRNKLITFFKDDPEIQKLCGPDGLEAYMRKKCPLIWKDFKEDTRILEAIGKGVILQTLKASAGADYTAALRPALSKKDRFLALCTAFSHYGKPYDYKFDFVTDSALVCTELVYKAYDTRKGKKGLRLPLKPHAGHNLCTPREIIGTFDGEYDLPDRQLDFAAFIDYDEEQQKVVWGTVESLRKTSERTKWSLLLE